MVQFIQNLIGNDVVSTIIISFVPLIELKGGIIFALGAGLGFFKSLGLAYIGSTLAFIPVFFLLIPILNLLKRIKSFKYFAEKIENYFSKKAEAAVNKKGNISQNGEKAATFLKQISVFIFVAIPLPMTGVYTGTAIAVFLGLKFKDSILPVALGNLVAGLLISALGELCIAVWDIYALNYILYGLLGLAVLTLVVTVIKIFAKKDKAEKE